ncbi:FAD-dependent monooxygenase [Aldersonia kunmingensis]|uniref:FAD-dependent monooxygenase n=1 Tax=Aldersonia kunmingensis TaxID=408066 RepID=UPI000835B82D|nr:FAD-dependent monooxygenase [Aldersonia kunmingensis]
MTSGGSPSAATSGRPSIGIAGAGIAGLALAGALHRSGYPVTVFEERPEFAPTGAGITIWPNALAALDSLGLGDRIRAAGNPVGAGGIRTADGRWLRRMDRARIEAALGEPLIAIHRVELIELLAEAIGTNDLRFSAGVTGFKPNGGRVKALLADGTTAEVDALIGADGFRSAIARQLQPDIRERYAGYTAWRGVAETDTAHLGDDGEPAEFWGRRHQFGFVPLGRGRTYWFATETAPAATTFGDDLDHLRSTLHDWPSPVAALLDATACGAISRHDIYDRTVARRWSAGAVTLVGDAAHPMRPHLGQGGCQALEDAAILGRLCEGSAPLDAFAEYERLRQRRARRYVRLSALAGRTNSLPWPLQGALHQVIRTIPDKLALRQLSAVSGRKAFR